MPLDPAHTIAAEFTMFKFVGTDLKAIPRSSSARFEAIRSGVSIKEEAALTLATQQRTVPKLLAFLRAQLESAEVLLAAAIETGDAEHQTRQSTMALAKEIIDATARQLDGQSLINILKAHASQSGASQLENERQHLKAMAAFALRLYWLLMGTSAGLNRQLALNELVKQLDAILKDPDETDSHFKALVARCKMWLTWREGWTPSEGSLRQSHLADYYGHHPQWRQADRTKPWMTAHGNFALEAADGGEDLETNREASRLALQPSSTATKHELAQLYYNRLVLHLRVAKGDLEIIITSQSNGAALLAFESALINFKEQTLRAKATLQDIASTVPSFEFNEPTAFAFYSVDALECQLQALYHETPEDPAAREAIAYRIWSEAPMRLLAAAEAYEVGCCALKTVQPSTFQAYRVAYLAVESARKAAEVRGGRDAPYFSDKSRSAMAAVIKIQVELQRQKAETEKYLFFSDVAEVGRAAADRVAGLLSWMRAGAQAASGERQPLAAGPARQTQ